MNQNQLPSHDHHQLSLTIRLVNQNHLKSMENRQGVLVPVANQFTAMPAIVHDQDRAATQLTAMQAERVENLDPGVAQPKVLKAERVKNRDPGVDRPKATQAENHDRVADLA